MRNRRGKFSTCHQCHQFIPVHHFTTQSISQSLIHNQDHSSSAFRDFLDHGPQALLRKDAQQRCVFSLRHSTTYRSFGGLKVTPIARAGQKKSQVQLNDLDDPRFTILQDCLILKFKHNHWSHWSPTEFETFLSLQLQV